MSTTTRSDGRRAAIITVTALLAALLTHGVYSASSPPRLEDPTDTTQALTPSPVAVKPREQQAPDVAVTPGTRSAAPSTAVEAAPTPTRVTLPSLDASLPVRPVGVDRQDAMKIPEDPDTAGWYRFGPAPTAASGASVIAAHTDTEGEIGPLSRLAELERGEHIRVAVGDEVLVYAVTRVDNHAKKALDLNALFDRSGPPRLHLVSCGGEWDPSTSSYEDNVIAVAMRITDPEVLAYGGSGGG
ncbi:class F sortase [Janibacter cremeus]|uniref:class F sortase n=1 Tax=Janibacter cremeus TaxID=1285192 RepID=UPI0023F8C36E|nr:class F sortase [Janibacter cremeus]WEV77140.1 class F sortase [Janibacter cremeus]